MVGYRNVITICCFLVDTLIMPEPSLNRLKCIFHDNSSMIEISNRIQGNSLRNLGNFWSLILEWKREAQGILRRRDLLSTHLMPIFFVIFLWVVIYQVILIKQSRISRRQLFKMVFILWRSTLEVPRFIKKLDSRSFDVGDCYTINMIMVCR